MSTDAEARCGAKTRNGGTCRNRPVTGRTRCFMHGGKSLRGEESPRWKHGLYARYWNDERAETMRQIALGEIDEVDFAREVLSLAHGRMTTAMQAVNDGTIDPNSKEVTAIAGELRQSVRGLVEAMAAQGEAPEEDRPAVEVLIVNAAPPPTPEEAG